MTKQHTLDRIDHQLLGLLQNDARRSNKELAAEVGLAPSSCLQRVRRLKETGVLRRFSAQIDPAALGITITAMIFVRLVKHNQRLMQTLQRRLLAKEECLELYYVAGSYDLLVHVAVRDVDHLRQVVTQALAARDEVAHVETALIFEHQRANAWPDYAAK